jgi:glycosyltransferase involved in cell wall biosynthesis
MARGSSGPLNILHVMRAPVGGLFRHVLDLARAQAERGHRVGLIADSSTGGANADARFAELAPALHLGISRVAMSRRIGPADITACRHVATRAAALSAQVVHGHGAKGGAYARLGAPARAVRAYTPHGGSLHYDWASPEGFLYLTLERALLRRTELFLFESSYGREVFRAKVGDPGTRARVIHNGLADAEFVPIAPDRDASDVVFVGELRVLKGVDVLIETLALLARQGRPTSAVIVGDGPEAAAFRRGVEEKGLSASVRFIGPMPARAAFARGRLLAVPSRKESLPYVVLEAAAAGVPMVASRVGGIPEIFGPDASALLPPGDPGALAAAIARELQPGEAPRETTLRLQARVRAQFSIRAMTDAVLAAYDEALASRNG